MTEVGALQDVDSGILAERIVQEAVSDIHRPHGGGAILQEAIGESSCRRTYIQTDFPLYRHAKGIQRAAELVAAAGDKPGLRWKVIELAGLLAVGSLCHAGIAESI